MEGYLSHVCQLLTGNASDMDARVSAAAHIAVIADSFWAAGEPVPRQLLPVCPCSIFACNCQLHCCGPLHPCRLLHACSRCCMCIYLHAAPL